MAPNAPRGRRRLGGRQRRGSSQSLGLRQQCRDIASPWLTSNVKHATPLRIGELPDMTSASERGWGHGKAEVLREDAGILCYKSDPNGDRGVKNLNNLRMSLMDVP